MEKEQNGHQNEPVKEKEPEQKEKSEKKEEEVVRSRSRSKDKKSESRRSSTSRRKRSSRKEVRIPNYYDKLVSFSEFMAMQGRDSDLEMEFAKKVYNQYKKKRNLRVMETFFYEHKVKRFFLNF